MEEQSMPYDYDVQKKGFEYSLAKGLSIIFHPLLMPCYGVVLFYLLDTHIGSSLNPIYKWILSGMIIVNMCVIPIALSFLLKKLGLIRSLKMENKRDRWAPYLVSLLFYIIAYFTCLNTNQPGSYEISVLILGAAAVLFLVTAINFFWKISAHMAGVGSVVGALAGISMEFHIPVLPFIILGIFLAGLVGYARLKLQSHNSWQVYIGFTLGFLTQFLLIHFLI